MKFSAALALVAAPMLALAQTANPFKIPTTGLTAKAGTSVTLNWDPTTSGTVSLILRSGPSGSLDTGTPIAQSIPNSGTYTWSVPASLVRGSDYTVEIVSDADKSKVNYTPQFVIDSTNTVASPSPSAPSSDPSSSAASATTGAPQSTPAAPGNATAPGASTGSPKPNSPKTGSSTTTSNSTSSGNGGAGFQSGSPAPGQSSSGASRATTVAAGIVGLVAFGALFLY